MSEETGTHKEALVSACGALSTILVAGALGFVEVKFGWAIYSFMFFFIIPIGAGFAGFAAASGYYLGAKLFNQKPAGSVLLNMIAASIGAFFMIKYIPYYLMDLEGIPIRDFISFWNYLDLNIQNTSLSFSFRGHSAGSTGELGSSWGYAYVGLQILGFAFGGLAVFGWLSNSPYCEKCSKYMKKTGEQERYTSNSDELVKNISVFAKFLVDKKCQKGIEYHNSVGDTDLGSCHLKLQIIVHQCPSCEVNNLDFVVQRLTGDDWEDVKETRIIHQTEEKLELTK